MDTLGFVKKELYHEYCDAVIGGVRRFCGPSSRLATGRQEAEELSVQFELWQHMVRASEKTDRTWWEKGGRLARAPRVSAGPPEPFVAPTKRRSLSLFTGCGALDYALPWCSPVAYCERDPDAAAVLRARMLDGCLTSSTPFARNSRTVLELLHECLVSYGGHYMLVKKEGRED